jgi:hypothetical protein
MGAVYETIGKGDVIVNTDDCDNYLVQQGVRFLPWIGRKYEQGFSNQRLLILGESHYDKWNGERHVLNKNITRQCIQEVVDRKDCSDFWKYIEQALLNEVRSDGWCLSGGMPFWGKVAFYNFVQEAIPGGPREAPPQKSLFQKSHAPFRIVLEQLRPDRVIVCGKRLWRNMENRYDNDCYHNDVQAYRLIDGTKVWCLATVHPSSGRYSWKRVHCLVMKFLDQPESAAELLSDKIQKGTDQAS